MTFKIIDSLQQLDRLRIFHAILESDALGTGRLKRVCDVGIRCVKHAYQV